MLSRFEGKKRRSISTKKIAAMMPRISGRSVIVFSEKGIPRTRRMT